MDRSFALSLAGLTALNVLLAWAFLLRGRAPVGVRRVLEVVLLVLLANALEMLLLSRWRLHIFGVMHIAWLDLWLVAPLAGAALALTRWRGRDVTWPALALALAALPGLPLGLYAQLVVPYDVRLERTDVPVDAARSGRDELLIAVLADIQSTTIEPHQLDAVAELMAAEPDIVLIPGDLYQGPVDQFEQNLPGFTRLLSMLHAPGGVWAVPGNADVPSLLPRTLAGTDIRLLRDELVTVSVGDRQVTILGLDEIPHEQFQVLRQPPAILHRFLAAPGDELRILMAHRPLIVSALGDDSRCDLVVAGHTHGGQVALPFIGPPITLSPLPRHVAAGGLHELAGNLLYVSRGLGMERLQAPRIRFGVPPEVTLLTLRTARPRLPDPQATLGPLPLSEPLH
ncbi:MAG: phosphohydrolase [Planctomycetota bacterium]|nr:MAG: phosphohydrolase [Planctomycetota bacterium]